MPQAAEPKSLSAKQLAELFTLLKRLEASGLPAFQAVAMLMRSEVELKPALAAMHRQLSAGKPISQAGYAAGIFNDTHKALIAAAENSGQLTEVYGLLADYYTALSSRLRKVKARLYLPGLILTLALLVQPLPALIVAQISGVQYVQLSLGRLAIIGGGMYALIKLPAVLQRLGAISAFHHLQLRIPAIAAWIVKRQLNEFFFLLALLLEAGLAFSEALPKAVATIKNTALRERFKPALALLGSGASVTDTLRAVPVIKPATLHIIAGSEHSGKLAGGIRHFTRLEAETIALQDEALAEWLPRLVYALIAAWIAHSILVSRIATVLPSDL
ncbi:MAG: type II secretion system F family protein [Gammaproteobacteria bacterium]